MTPSEIRLLALSLYASARKVERLPRYAEHDPRTIVEIVAVPAHLVVWVGEDMHVATEGGSYPDPRDEYHGDRLYEDCFCAAEDQAGES